LWLHSLKVEQLLRSAACLHTNQSRSYLNHLVHNSIAEGPYSETKSPQVFKEFPAFYETQNSLPCFKSPPLAPFLGQMNQSTLFHPIYLRRILLLSFPLLLGFSIGRFSSGFQTQTLPVFLFNLPFHTSSSLITLIMSDDAYAS